MPQSAISDSVRRWTWMLGQLRSRALRLKRRSSAEPPAADALLDEALELSNGLLLDLAGAELQLKKAREALDAERRESSAVFDRMPVASVITDGAGLISVANRRAVQLLNVSARHLAGRPFLHFSQDRAACLALLHALPRDGSAATATVTIRPRERRTLDVDITVIPRTANDATEWVWFLTPENANSSVERERLDTGDEADAGADRVDVASDEREGP